MVESTWDCAKRTVLDEHVPNYQLWPANHKALGDLLKLPMQREPQFREGEAVFSKGSKGRSNMTALCMQIAGVEAQEPCNPCKEMNGPWDRCVVAPNHAVHAKVLGACANCLYNRNWRQWSTCTISDELPRADVHDNPIPPTQTPAPREARATRGGSCGPSGNNGQHAFPSTEILPKLSDVQMAQFHELCGHLEGFVATRQIRLGTHELLSRPEARNSWVTFVAWAGTIVNQYGWAEGTRMGNRSAAPYFSSEEKRHTFCQLLQRAPGDAPESSASIVSPPPPETASSHPTDLDLQGNVGPAADGLPCFDAQDWEQVGLPEPPEDLPTG